MKKDQKIKLKTTAPQFLTGHRHLDIGQTAKKWSKILK